MKRLLVLGYGNGLRRDDGAGPEVVRRLRYQRLPGMEAVESHQLLPEHAELLSRFGQAVFVDASIDPGPEGLRISRVEPSAQAGFATHHSGPAALLGLSEVLYGHAPEAWLIAIPAHDLGIGEGLSSEVDRWCGLAVSEVYRIWSEGMQVAV